MSIRFPTYTLTDLVFVTFSPTLPCHPPLEPCYRSLSVKSRNDTQLQLTGTYSVQCNFSRKTLLIALRSFFLPILLPSHSCPFLFFFFFPGLMFFSSWYSTVSGPHPTTGTLPPTDHRSHDRKTPSLTLGNKEGHGVSQFVFYKVYVDTKL